MARRGHHAGFTRTRHARRWRTVSGKSTSVEWPTRQERRSGRELTDGAGQCEGEAPVQCGGGVSRWLRSGAPRWSASSLAAPGKKGDREGHANSTVKYSKAGLTGKGEKVAAAAQNPSRNR
jgi:hypothetical protein